MGVNAAEAAGGSGSGQAADFDSHLDIAQASQTVADYLNSKGEGSTNSNEIKDLAKNGSGDVKQAAEYLVDHKGVLDAIDTHDAAGVDGLMYTSNVEWAAQGGLADSSVQSQANTDDAIGQMKATFDSAIASSAKVTQVTTEEKSILDSAKQRPQN
ncbi:hypothetical protein [Carnimonas bestiolae]|uniref:hypothetical protein n=1 Tax=Carnimonas bestiolae TaxID=3402172 RepID=UPI003EDC928E